MSDKSAETNPLEALHARVRGCIDDHEPIELSRDECLLLIDFFPKPAPVEEEELPSAVRFTTANGKLYMYTPYAPAFPERVKKELAGKWSPGKKAWVVDARDLNRARAICQAVYGEDDRGAPRVCVRLNSTEQRKGWPRSMELYVAGRMVASCTGRDSGAYLGTGIAVIRKGFHSGGSKANPELNWSNGTLFDMRDVPRPKAEKLVADGWEYGTAEIIPDDRFGILDEGSEADPPSEEQPASEDAHDDEGARNEP